MSMKQLNGVGARLADSIYQLLELSDAEQFCAASLVAYNLQS
jgi:hypothetical protein